MPSSDTAQDILYTRLHAGETRRIPRPHIKAVKAMEQIVPPDGAIANGMYPAILRHSRSHSAIGGDICWHLSGAKSKPDVQEQTHAEEKTLENMR
jgi:hypothetical protein